MQLILKYIIMVIFCSLGISGIAQMANQDDRAIFQEISKNKLNKLPKSLYCSGSSAFVFVAIKFKNEGYNIIDSVNFLNTKDSDIIKIIEPGLIKANFSKINRQNGDTILIIPFLFVNDNVAFNNYSKMPSENFKISGKWMKISKYRVLQPYFINMEYLSEATRKEEDKIESLKKMNDEYFPKCDCEHESKETKLKR